MSGKSAVIVSVVGLRSKDGLVCGALFSGSQGFPDDLDQACALCEVRIEEKVGAMWRAELVFEGVEAGTYAVSMIHDENENGELDVGLFGIPKEGFGFSQNPKIRFGPPKFQAASFVHSGRGETRVEIRTVHLSKP